MKVNSDHPPVSCSFRHLVSSPSFFADGVAGDAVPAESATACDAEVIRLSLRDPERFAEIFHRYFAAIHRYASARLGAGAADDIAAETFLAAFRQRERYDLSRRDARAWLFGIATNLIRRHRRDEVRLYRALERARDASAVARVRRRRYPADADFAQSRLAGALAVLKAGDREALLLIAYGELSYAEAADALGIPPGTVGSRLNRARKRVERSAEHWTSPPRRNDTMDEMNLLRDRADAQPAPRPEAVASALDRLHSAAREPKRAARRPIRLPGSRRRPAAAGPRPRRGDGSALSRT